MYPKKKMKGVLCLAAFIIASHAQWRQLSRATEGMFVDGPSAHPPGRRDAAIWCLPHDVVYLMGGRGTSARTDDIWRYEESTDRWIWLGDAPHAVSGATAWTTDDEHLWFFGGRTDDHVVLPGVHAYDINRRRWTEIAPTTQERPEARYGALSWYSAATGHLWVYGGKSANKTLLQDMWTFDKQTLAWSPVAATSPPGPRDDGAVAHQGASVYMLGGETSSLELWHLDVNTMEWTQRATLAITGGTLQDHAMWMTPAGDQLIVFGGKTASGDASRDTWVYTISDDTWTKASSVPSVRWGASVCQDPEGYTFLVAGALTNTDFINDAWKHGQQYNRVLDVISGDTLQGNTAAVMAALTFVLLMIVVIVQSACWCYRRRKSKINAL